jgi:membrane protein DedA with SNARE-associated domain
VKFLGAGFTRHLPYRLELMSAWLISLVSSGGLVAIFVTMAGESAGLPISSEIVVPLGGALAAQGRLSFWLVVVASTLGNLAGSLIAYLLTRRYGERFVLSRAGRWIGLSRGHLRLAHRFFDRFGVWAVFLGRLLPIVRTYISFPAGISTVGLRTFTVATLLGAFPWNLGLAYAGLKLGQHWEEVGRYLGPVGIPVAILVVLLLGLAWWYGRKFGEDEEAAEPAAKSKVGEAP